MVSPLLLQSAEVIDGCQEKLKPNHCQLNTGTSVIVMIFTAVGVWAVSG
jgi:hypothetical protein